VRTRRETTSTAASFAAFLKRSPDTPAVDDIRWFQLYLAEAGMSICSRNRTMTGLRFLFRVTLRRLDLATEIYHIREPQKIPLVMSSDETRGLPPSRTTSRFARYLHKDMQGHRLRRGELNSSAFSNATNRTKENRSLAGI
jgi:integrase/recombinase XerD